MRSGGSPRTARSDAGTDAWDMRQGRLAVLSTEPKLTATPKRCKARTTASDRRSSPVSTLRTTPGPSA